MINILLLFWNRQTARQKATTIIICMLVFVIFFLWAKFTYSTYQNNKFLKSFSEAETEKVKQANLKIDSLVNLQSEFTKEVQTKSIKTQTKYKKDVEKINNSTVTDKQLYDMLAKYD